MQTNYIGADIGKENIDIFFINKHFVIKNKTQAIINFFKTIDQSNEKYFVVCEPTGGYEEVLIKTLRNLKIPVKAEHSNKVTHLTQVSKIFRFYNLPLILILS